MTQLEHMTVRTTGPDRAQARQRGLDLWHEALASAEDAASATGCSREDRLDATRVLDVRRREQEALLARTAGQDPTGSDDSGPRAVVGHRHQWTRDALVRELAAHGVEVVAVGDNGADVVGCCVAEQPDLVVLDDTLAMRSGVEVAQELRRFCTGTVVAGVVTGEAAVAPLLEAGAVWVRTRRVPPAQAVQELVALLAQRSAAPQTADV